MRWVLNDIAMKNENYDSLRAQPVLAHLPQHLLQGLEFPSLHLRSLSSIPARTGTGACVGGPWHTAVVNPTARGTEVSRAIALAAMVSVLTENAICK